MNINILFVIFILKINQIKYGNIVMYDIKNDKHIIYLLYNMENLVRNLFYISYMNMIDDIKNVMKNKLFMCSVMKIVPPTVKEKYRSYKNKDLYLIIFLYKGHIVIIATILIIMGMK